MFLPGTDKLVTLLEYNGTSPINWTSAKSLQEAVETALAASAVGDVILFSPAFASFGLFKNEYERNDEFMTLALAVTE